MVDVRAAKKQARTLARARRRELVESQTAADRGAQGDALARAFLTWLREYAEALGRADLAGLTVTAYEEMPTEPPVSGLVRAAQEVGMRVLLPVTILETRTLRWVDAAGGSPADEGPEALLGVDIALIPGLAVDPEGYRLGQGGGFYDRALPMVRTGVPVIVALHDHELPGSDTAPVPQVPHESHDIRVDGVLTSAGVRLTRQPH
ncbi:5-formyltetrahydrofolate cyclo-ligase [Ornithinimicrobium cryptoxanthini]|uniref:Ligase n=1 Tax=Ornithinimicrobium cryptoxanthini TaxID=2934161 RepID=A0ABY4YGE9_9MICO|nr:5-formyltetrahydrofolate cyclo-ligase [Ornithinimicrobium cryptoxanthini]USQ75832.1 ligase [Ornithinimicrobium cryptoxanthini]